MAQLELVVAGRTHMIQCRDGEEGHVRALGRHLNKYADAATRASGGMSAERTMLYLALIMADEAVEARAGRGEAAAPGPAAPPAEAPIAPAIPMDLLERVADRLESVAAMLEEAAPAS